MSQSELCFCCAIVQPKFVIAIKFGILEAQCLNWAPKKVEPVLGETMLSGHPVVSGQLSVPKLCAVKCNLME